MSALPGIDAAPRRRVLNVGSGPAHPLKLHAAFRAPGWTEIRLDVEPSVRPDILGDMVDMRASVADAGFDAIWSSHNIEHLEAHRVPQALAEFVRVLKPHGFALITCPDAEAVARLVVERGLDCVVYESPAGPVTPRDMLWGFGPSIANGFGFMAHRTGFTAESLGRLVLAAGFGEVRVASERFALWALCLMPDAEPASIAADLGGTEAAFLFDGAYDGPCTALPP